MKRTWSDEENDKRLEAALKLDDECDVPQHGREGVIMENEATVFYVTYDEQEQSRGTIRRGWYFVNDDTPVPQGPYLAKVRAENAANEYQKQHEAA